MGMFSWPGCCRKGSVGGIGGGHGCRDIVGICVWFCALCVFLSAGYHQNAKGNTLHCRSGPGN